MGSRSEGRNNFAVLSHNTGEDVFTFNLIFNA